MRGLELFCDVDDFWQLFEPAWRRQLLAEGALKCRRKTRLSESEIMTLLILFHRQGVKK